MTMETVKRMLAVVALFIVGNLQDLFVFGGLAMASYGIAQVAGAGYAWIAAGAGVCWLGLKR